MESDLCLDSVEKYDWKNFWESPEKFKDLFGSMWSTV